MVAHTFDPVELDSLRSRWRAALLSADAALKATSVFLGPDDRYALRKRLSDEYAPTATLLRTLARDEGIPLALAEPFLPRGLARSLLRLPPIVTSCVFNLDGVLVGSAALHVAAWERTFDELLSSRLETTYRRVTAPFDPGTDYPTHIHGRPRLEGVRTFLASRGIRLPEGSPSDRPGSQTVHGLANRKNELLGRLLDEHGLSAFEGSRHYLEIAHDAGMKCAVVSASAHTETILQRAGLAGLVDGRVDAETILAEGLRGRPQPDRLLAACRKLGVDPDHAAVFEDSAAGVAAGHAAGFKLVVAIDADDDAGHVRDLRREGADLVVPALGELLLHAA